MVKIAIDGASLTEINRRVGESVEQDQTARRLQARALSVVSNGRKSRLCFTARRFRYLS